MAKHALHEMNTEIRLRNGRLVVETSAVVTELPEDSSHLKLATELDPSDVIRRKLGQPAPDVGSPTHRLGLIYQQIVERHTETIHASIEALNRLGLAEYQRQFAPAQRQHGGAK